MHLDIRSWEGPNEEAIWGHFAPASRYALYGAFFMDNLQAIMIYNDSLHFEFRLYYIL